MIPLALATLARPESSFAGLSVVTIEGPDLRSYPVVGDGKRGLRLGIPVSREVRRVDDDPSAERLYVSPDGRRIAVLARGRGGYEVLLFASKNLSPLATRRLPGFAELRWAPDSEHLAYQTLDRRSYGIVAVSSDARFAVAPWPDELAWSKAGDALFVPQANAALRGQKERWLRYGLRTGKRTATTFASVRRGSWLDAEVPGERPLWLGSPLLQWTPHGVLAPFYKSDHFYFAVDFALNRTGRHKLQRPGIMNTASTQLYPSARRVYYVQGDRLFDRRDAPDDAVWLGIWDPVSGRRTQTALRVGPSRTHMAFRLTITGDGANPRN